MKRISWLKLLTIEWSILKNSLAFWAVWVAPLVVVFMNFMIYLTHEEMLLAAEVNPWKSYFGNISTMWGGIFYPLIVTCVVFLVHNVHHQGLFWKHLFVMPIPRKRVVMSKFIITIFLIFIINLNVVVGSYAALYLLKLIYPALVLSGNTIHLLIASVYLKIFIAALGLTAIQFLISVLVKNFIVPLGIGLTAVFAVLFLMRWEHIHFFPYAYPIFMGIGFRDGVVSLIKPELGLSLLCMLIFLFISLQWTSRKDIH